MDKGVFGNIIEHRGQMGPGDVEQLRRACEKYPYCAPLQVLSLMADKVSGTPLWEQMSLPRVRLYMMDANRLDTLLNAKPEPVVAPDPAVKEASMPENREEDFDVLKEINAYQEISFKTAPKSVILTNFLEKDGGIVLNEGDFDSVSVQELAKKSIVSDGLLETEPMAVMLERQGKLEQAVTIYKKLMLKYPEKSSIFAVRISEVEKRLSEKKEK